MRVLFLTQHFAPEVTAGRFRVESFVEGLTKRGHEVRVICPVPNHPRGVIEPGYGGRLLLRRSVGDACITYVRVVVVRRKTFARRVAYYASYAAAATTVGLLEPKPDVIVASSPPLTVLAAGTLLARLHRVPLLLDIRDVWPDSPRDLGEIGAGPTFAALSRVERALYGRAAGIVTANEAFANLIAERAPAATPLYVVSNATTQEWLDMGKSDVTRDSVEYPADRFVWAYAGNVGLAHGLEHTVDAARLLGETYLLVVIGEGPRRRQLEARVAATPSLVEFRGLMAPLDAARHLRAADAVLVSERQETVVSAKLYDCCAIGRPIVAACRGELRRIIEREGIGLAVPHGDPAALAQAIRQIESDAPLRARLVERAREFATAHLREAQAARFTEIVESVERRER